MADPLKAMIEKMEADVEHHYAGTAYVDSYVAFLDIMGMKQLVKRPYSDMRRIFNAAEAAKKLYASIRVPGATRFIAEDHLKMTIMSDSIVLSIPTTIDYSFSKIVGCSSYLIQKLIGALPDPIFLRGGIAKGPIYQDGATVFGPGLVAAYNLENEAAKTMRCVISPRLVETDDVKAYLDQQGSALISDPSDALRFIAFVREENRERIVNFARDVLRSNPGASLTAKYSWLHEYASSWADV